MNKLLKIIKKVIISVRINGVKYTVFHIINVHIFRVLNDMTIAFFATATRYKDLQNIIVIQSHGDFDCNGGALYNYLLKNNYNEKYKLVWILRHDIPKKLPQNVEAYSLYRPGIKKSLRICLAKYFFADDNIIVKPRKDQVSTYCEHGIMPFKDTRGKMDLRNKGLNYCLAPSENIDILSRKSWMLLDDKTIELIHLGYPCQDIFFTKSVNEYSKISIKTFEKYILWMPTFRRSNGNRNDSTEDLPFGIPLLKNEEMFNELNEMLNKKNILLTIKIHPSQHPDTYKKLKNRSNILVITPQKERELNLDKYNLMKYTDALISDYSSVSFEYLPLNNPIGYVISDIDNYKIGFIMDNPKDYMVGDLIVTYRELVNFIDNISNNIDKYKNKRLKLLNYIYKYKDGKSCERLIRFLGIE